MCATPLPTGTVTFLFTDIEHSTQLLQRLGGAYANTLTTHQRLLREAFTSHAGHEVDTQGDSFFVAFATAPEALAAATAAMQALAAHPWPEESAVWVRMGLHVGAPQLVGEHYVGLDVHRAARIAAAGHGGQILLSAAVAELVRHNLPEGVTLRDLGAHRLKDLRQAEHIFEAVVEGLPADFPALKALDARPHNLSIHPDALVGREREVGEALRLLRRDDVRLVTLTGPGGIGKTRLSLEVAAEALDAFPDGVWSVRLSRLTDPELVVPTIAQVFDLKERVSAPVSEVVRAHLTDKRLLLILDNFEQVVAAAPAIGDLLAACPGVKALVTSRTPLHLRGEREYILRPLALPDPAHLPPLERLSQYAAVTLFIERAQAAQADFAVTSQNAPAIAEICVQLDGLPLAIELAAARVKILPPAALLRRLEHSLTILTGGARDVDARQQTMRATLAWSYALLAPEEQRLFRRLAVFVGGWTLESAEAVCTAPKGAALLELDLLEGLSQLVDHSLVQLREDDEGAPRFSFLYVIREFALEQSEASGEVESLRRAHAQYVLALVTRYQVFGPGAPWWLATMEREDDNLRAALQWTLDRREAEMGLQIAAAASGFWVSVGRLREGARWLEAMLAAEEAHAAQAAINGVARSREALVARGHALGFLGNQVGAAGDLDRSEALFREVEQIARTTGELPWVALARNFLAMITLSRGEIARGLAQAEESLALARQSESLAAMLTVSQNFVLPLLIAGDMDRAALLAEESLDLARRSESTVQEVIAYACLAFIAVHRGEYEQARAHVLEAVRFKQIKRVAASVSEWDFLYALTIASARQGEHERAARLAGAFASKDEREDVVLDEPTRAYVNGALAPSRSALGEKAWAEAYTAGRALSPEQAIAEALQTAAGDAGAV